jgi:P-type Ca2+ transporter type 2C
MLEKRFTLIDYTIVGKTIFMSFSMAIISLIVFAWYVKTTNNAYARTMALMTMAMAQWFNAWNCRSENKSIFYINFFSNKWLIMAMTFVLFLQFFIVYVSWAQKIFKTVPLTILDWLFVFGASFFIIILEEFRKLLSTILCKD